MEKKEFLSMEKQYDERVIEIAREGDIVHPVADMEMGDG